MLPVHSYQPTTPQVIIFYTFTKKKVIIYCTDATEKICIATKSYYPVTAK